MVWNYKQDAWWSSASWLSKAVFNAISKYKLKQREEWHWIRKQIIITVLYFLRKQIPFILDICFNFLLVSTGSRINTGGICQNKILTRLFNWDFKLQKCWTAKRTEKVNPLHFKLNWSYWSKGWGSNDLPPTAQQEGCEICGVCAETFNKIVLRVREIS